MNGIVDMMKTEGGVTDKEVEATLSSLMQHMSTPESEKQSDDPWAKPEEPETLQEQAQREFLGPLTDMLKQQNAKKRAQQSEEKQATAFMVGGDPKWYQ